MFSHFEPLSKDPSIDHYMVRLFPDPVGELDLETGQPWGPYYCCFLVSVQDGSAEIRGAQILPLFALHFMRKSVGEHGIKKFFYNRWINGVKRRVDVK